MGRLAKIVGGFVYYVHERGWTGKILGVTDTGELTVKWNDGTTSDVPKMCVVAISQERAEARGFRKEAK